MRKTTKYALIAGLIILGLAAFCAKNAVMAEEDYHWKFIVPVELKNMHPDAKSFHVNVNVKDSAGKVIGSTAGTNVPIPANGNYAGQVEVKLKAAPGQDPFAAKTYTAILIINDNTQASNVPDAPIYAKPKEGTEFVSVIIGPIPPQ